MDEPSPPKRMTRARAAATKDVKQAAPANTTTTSFSTTSNTTATAPASKPTKAASRKAAPAKATSSSTAKATTTATTTTRATKRKTRSDENEDEDAHQTDTEQQGTTMNQPPKTRGRPKKVAVAAPEPQPEPQSEPEASGKDAATASTKSTRGKARKPSATTTTPAVAPKEEPAKTTRTTTRTRKVAKISDDSNADTPAEPVQKTTRSRATSTTKKTTGTVTTTVATEPTPGLKSAISRPASRVGGIVKKTVTFQEREKEKENMVPSTVASRAKSKSKTETTEPATGMRAKPVRKPAAGGRTTRASAKSAATSEKRDKSPLSPKKDVQNRSMPREVDSDDELATMDKTPLKPLMKSPVKPPSSAKKPDLQPPTKDADEKTEENSEPAGQSALGSPARRPPASAPSLFGDVKKSPMKKLDGDAAPSLVGDSMKSPAKKADGITYLFFSKNDQQPTAQSPTKSSHLASPAKRPQLPIKALQPPPQDSEVGAHSPVKMSFLQSPAKRPASPFKLQAPPAQPFGDNANKLFAPKTSPTEEKEPIVEQPSSPEITMSDAGAEDEGENEFALGEQSEEDGAQLESPSLLTFPGRLSAVLPRHADPALRDNPLPAKDVETEQPEPTLIEPAETVVAVEAHVETEAKTEPKEEFVAETEDNELVDDPMDVDAMDVDEVEANEHAPSPAPTTPPQSPPKQAINSAFGLRAKDIDNYVSDSEDELAASEKTLNRFQDDATLSFNGVPATPTPATLKTPRGMPSSAIKAASRAIRSVSKGSRFGFTPLAGQLSEWKASSPQKSSNIAQPSQPSPAASQDEGFSMLRENDTAPAEFTPTKGLFDEEMKIRAEMDNQAAMEAALEADIAAQYEDEPTLEPEFDVIAITNEDIELAAEAKEMSIMEPCQLEERKDGHAHDDSISEASQEYGDENAVPIDPVLLGTNAGARILQPMTPMRKLKPLPLGFNTTTKVPLKPADDSSPKLEIMKNRSASASKLTSSRPNGLFRNATVISYSPTKDSGDMESDGDELPPVTPSKADIWSSMGTPARTPRRDLNNALLRGAVVFVDVHTSDGADASSVFVELLTHMGARCVKQWPWNPTGSNGEASTSKIGITHVVFKDGGKRTLEKVRESNGVVQCVGVGWVLE